MSMHLDVRNFKEPAVFATGGDTIPDGFCDSVPFATLIKKIDGDLLKLHADLNQLHAIALECQSKTSGSSNGDVADEIDSKRCTDIEPKGPDSPKSSNWDRTLSPITEVSQAKIVTREEKKREYEKVCSEHQAEVEEYEPIIEQFTLSRRIARAIIGSRYFEPAFAIFIAANTITNAIETNHAAVYLSATPPALCDTAQSIFNGLFLLELVIRIAGSGLEFLWDKEAWYWNWFDIVCCFGIVLEILIGLFQSTEMIGDMSRYRIIKIARMTRLARVVRVSRLLRFLKALRHLVLSIMSTLRSLAWSLILLLTIFFCFSTILLEGATEYRMRDRAVTDPVRIAEFERWWGSMPGSFNTLFMSITGGVSWMEPAMPLDALDIVYPFTFLSFIAFSVFTFLNVVTGCFCESAIANAQKDEEIMLSNEAQKFAEYAEKLHAMFSIMDTDGSSSITLDEFVQKLEEEKMQLLFKTLDIDVHDAKDFFRLLDSDESGRVDVEELLLGCMRMKGGARGIDMFRVIHDINHLTTNVEHLSLAVEESLQRNISLSEKRIRTDEKERWREIVRSASGLASPRNHRRNRHHNTVDSASSRKS